MSVTFMKGCIGNRTYWLPKIQDIRLLNCIDPPSRVDLARMVADSMRGLDNGPPSEPFDTSFRRTASEIEKKPPNQEWLVAMLSTLNPNSELFRKDYVKPKPLSKFAAPDDVDVDMVANDDGFFSGLPLASKSSKHSSTVRFSGDSEALQKQKLRKMQLQRKLLDQRIAKS